MQTPPSDVSPTPFDRRPIFALLLIALAFVGLGLWLLQQRATLSESTPAGTTLVDLDAENEGGFRGWIQDPPWPAPALSLTASNGEPFTIEDARGQNLLVFFGFTHCPDVCPQTLSKLAASVRAYEEAAPERNSDATQALPQVVFVSVDPERDTPEVMNEYLSRFDMPVTGLSGDLAAIDEIVAEYGVVYYKEFPEDIDPDSPEAEDNYTVVHTGTVFLIDQLGLVRATYREPFAPEDIALDLRLLDAEGEAGEAE